MSKRKRSKSKPKAESKLKQVKLAPICPTCNTAEHMQPGHYGASCSNCGWFAGEDSFVIVQSEHHIIENILKDIREHQEYPKNKNNHRRG